VSKDYIFKGKPIESLAWGSFNISGQNHGKVNGQIIGSGKDIVLNGENVFPWKERKGHNLTTDMVISPLRQLDIDTLVIGNGVYGALNVSSELINHLTSKTNIKKVVVLKTHEACQYYNDLFANDNAATPKIALLAHGTC